MYSIFNTYNLSKPHYTWADQSYKEFIMSFLLKLEPFCYPPFYHIVYVLDEYNDVTFVQEGAVDIGFEFNKKQNFVVRKEKGCVVGAFGITFYRRSRYIYRSNNKQVTGYFIRKEAWLNILDQKESLAKNLKQNILSDYIMNIRVKA